ncbi:kinase-like domain-containing protein [Mycena crocata]|nr:kinase-like domain-containing protein [Mycena crocata]
MASAMELWAPKRPKKHVWARRQGHEELGRDEMFWYNHRNWLESKGYVLRARYQDDWVPSWQTSKKVVAVCEDGVVRLRASIMDATHVEDGAFVVLKKISSKTHPCEVDIATWFSAESQRSDPENHCVPIREVLQSPIYPDIRFIVMPLLQPFDKPRFDSIGEAVSFFRQIFEGLKYIHKHNVAHRDCTTFNIMMDGSPLYSTPIHPIEADMKRDYSGHISNRSRTQCPVKYYITDFGISRRYNPEDFPVFEEPILAADRSPPEYRRTATGEGPPNCDPFATDVYYLGNLVRENFIQGSDFVTRKRGFEFMEPLIADMTNENPSLRPTMEQVVDRFEDIARGLSTWNLRSEVKKDRQRLSYLRSIFHCVLTLRLIAGRYPPIPMP